MTALKKITFALFVPLFAVFASCATMIDGEVRSGGAADIAVDASLEPRTIALIHSLRGFMGGPADAPILDGAAISQSMADAPGVLAVSLVNSSPTALSGTVSVSNVGDFLLAGDAEGQFITFTEGQAAGTSSIVVNLDRTSAPALIARLTPELGGYLSALMAPVVLGETMTRQEYLSLVAMIYGQPLADEIAAASIRASVQFPRPVTAIQGGTAAGNRAQFDVPLVDLLVLEHPLRYEVSW
ncbi:MAG: hypothetical protein FWC64_12645 [Treponema sp.]|nr:hypothetical protein [Treponema sp.]